MTEVGPHSLDTAVAAAHVVEFLTRTTTELCKAKVLDAAEDHVSVLFERTECVVNASATAIVVEHQGHRWEYRWDEFPAQTYRIPPGNTMQRAIYRDREEMFDAQLTKEEGPWHVLHAPGWVLATVRDAVLRGYTAARNKGEAET